MIRDLTVDHLVFAGIALAAGLIGAFLARMLLRWLGKHAGRTRWSGDDVIVDALRSVVPWAAVLSGAAGAAAALPLTRTVQHNVNQGLTVLFIAVVTVSAARVVAGLVRTVTTSRSGVAGSATIFVNITRASLGLASASWWR
ncbi:Mechanosensitive ion channel protein OS=Streptomyces fumanus OX=67302 GN=GCM10018772_36060 PE=3 SV=1 [Streptomyces fumanus]